MWHMRDKNGAICFWVQLYTREQNLHSGTICAYMKKKSIFLMFIYLYTNKMVYVQLVDKLSCAVLVIILHHDYMYMYIMFNQVSIINIVGREQFFMRTTKTLISLRDNAVWSASMLFVTKNILSNSCLIVISGLIRDKLYFGRYTIGNLSLRRRARGEPQNAISDRSRRYTSPYEKFEYGYINAVSFQIGVLQFA